MNAEVLWNLFVKKTGTKHTEYDAWQFGDSPDELLRLVLTGQKTATSSLFDLYELEGEELPKVGEYSVILNSNDEATCIIKNTAVNVIPFSAVRSKHAFKEGEGDRSLLYWKSVHRRFFSDELRTINRTFTEDLLVVLEEFEVVFCI